MFASWFLIAVSLTVVLAFGGLIGLRRRAGSRPAGSDWDWAREFSVEKYLPMQRLLSEDDHQFLKAQPGYHPALSRILRQSRCRVFRSYLRSVRRDFNRLYWAAKQSVLYMESDQTAMVKAIARQRATFYWALLRVEVRLSMYTLGLGSVDVRPILEALESLRDATRVLQPAAA